jgi:hypothetical protein
MKKGDSFYLMTESTSWLCPTAIWKEESVDNKLGFLVEVSKQIIEIMVSFFLIAYSVKDGKEKT